VRLPEVVLHGVVDGLEAEEPALALQTCGQQQTRGDLTYRYR
jgi:hypothetical protein